MAAGAASISGRARTSLRPSEALVAQADAKAAFDTLFLGLGAVALLIGASEAPGVPGPPFQ